MRDIERKICHVNTGEGAILSLLTGQALPVIKALKSSKLKV